MNAGKVDVLLILGGNPVYDAPADFDFGPALLQSVSSACIPASITTKPASFATGTFPPRISSKPGAMPARTTARSASFSRLIAPLYDGAFALRDRIVPRGRCRQIRPRSGARLLEGPAAGKGQGLRGFLGSARCTTALMAGTALPAISVSVRPASPQAPRCASYRDCRFDWKLSFVPIPPSSTAISPTMAGCQELPKPITRLTWDNAAMVSPATAQQFGLATGDT